MPRGQVEEPIGVWMPTWRWIPSEGPKRIDRFADWVITLPEASQLTGVSVQTIWRWAKTDGVDVGSRGKPYPAEVDVRDLIRMLARRRRTQNKGPGTARKRAADRGLNGGLRQGLEMRRIAAAWKVEEA